MITIQLRFDEQLFSHLTGPEAPKFFADYMREFPQDLYRKADEVTISGPFGKYSEIRE